MGGVDGVAFFRNGVESAPPNLPRAQALAALTWQEVTSPGPAVHLRRRGQVRSPGRSRESQFPGRGGR